MLIRNIPDTLINKLKNTEINTVSLQPFIQDVIQSKSVNKPFYDMQMKNRKCQGKTSNETKWEENIQKHIDWKKIYQLPFKSTLDVTLKKFPV
jgi:hypothetical protein